MRLAENLQLLRKENGISQEFLAEKCQVSRQAIAKWESGESVPTLDKLIFLAELYEVSLDELVGRRNIDKYFVIREYLEQFAAKDIPTNDGDDISAIVARYLEFVECTNLSAEEKLRGLEEIFLNR